jgi:cytochrome c biogenesis protein CcmG/thiol:disulfide interchange protein DsbE
VRQRGKLLVIVAVVSVVAALAGLLGWRMAEKQQGKGLAAAAAAGERPLAPDFELEQLNGDGGLALSSLRGRVVVLNFWASWCPPCREEAPVLQDGWERYREEGVVFLGVDANDLSNDAREFIEEHGITYPNVHDGEGVTLGRFGIPALPETMFIDRDGRVAAYVAGAVDAAALEQSIEKALAP